MPSGKLYIIGTPLGNRNDVTLRVKKTLESLTVFFAEDTRELSKLLEMFEISKTHKKFFSYAMHNMKEATEKAMKVLRLGQDVGLVSDRGMPCISDPGALMVNRAHQESVTVVVVPGPSSVTMALSASGFCVDRFIFLGFLPVQKSERHALFDHVREVGICTCFFESPKRVVSTLKELNSLFPDGTVFLAREMTKFFESFQRFPLVELDSQSILEQGEYTIVFEPGPRTSQGTSWEGEIDLRLCSEKEWAKTIATRYQVSSRGIYNALQKKKGLIS